MTTPIDITGIVKDVCTDTHGNREYSQRFIAWANDVVVGASESVEGIQADVIHCCGQAGIDVPASVLVWDQGQTLSPIDISTLDPALVADIAGEEGFQAFEAEYPGATVANQCYHIAFNADAGRGGIVFVGSGSSGETAWTDAESPEEVLARFLSDDMSP